MTIPPKCEDLYLKIAELERREAALREELDIATRHLDRMIEAHDNAQQRLTVAEQALGGMLFAFDDGVGREWSAPLLDFARTITPAAEFVAALKPAAEGEGS